MHHHGAQQAQHLAVARHCKTVSHLPHTPHGISYSTCTGTGSLPYQLQGENLGKRGQQPALHYVNCPTSSCRRHPQIDLFGPTNLRLPVCFRPTMQWSLEELVATASACATCVNSFAHRASWQMWWPCQEVHQAQGQAALPLSMSQDLRSWSQIACSICPSVRPGALCCSAPRPVANTR